MPLTPSLQSCNAMPHSPIFPARQVLAKSRGRGRECSDESPHLHASLPGSLAGSVILEISGWSRWFSLADCRQLFESNTLSYPSFMLMQQDTQKVVDLLEGKVVLIV